MRLNNDDKGITINSPAPDELKIAVVASLHGALGCGECIMIDALVSGYAYLINPFPHMTILQQTTLNLFCQNIENLHSSMDNL